MVNVGNLVEVPQMAYAKQQIPQLKVSESVSVLMDGEIPAEEWEQLMHSLQTPSSQADWHVYHLIGDALRSEELLETDGADRDFEARFAARFASEPHLLLPSVVAKSSKLRMAWVRRAIPTAAVVAAVVAVSWVVVPQLQGGSPVLVAQQDQQTLQKLPVAQTVAVVSTNPQTGPATGNITMIRDARLDDYLQAHGQYALRPAAPFVRAVSSGQSE